MKPDSLFWCDVETTGLDSEECDILELSFVVTSFEAPYAVREEGTFLVASRATFDILESDAQALKVCEELRVFEMHKASGLLSDVRDGVLRGALISYGNLDHRLLEMAKRLEWPTASRTPLTDEERRTLRRRMTRIAGSSCHMDLGFLRAKLPMFARYLSYRTFDVSAAEGFLESLGYVPELGAEAPKHRAMDDLRYSMALARKLSGWVRHPEIAKPGLTNAFAGYVSKIDLSSKYSHEVSAITGDAGVVHALIDDVSAVLGDLVIVRRDRDRHPSLGFTGVIVVNSSAR